MRSAFTVLEVLCIAVLSLAVLGPRNASAQTTNSCVSPLNSDFLTRYEILEAATYVETNSAGPVPNGPKAFGFEGIIKLATNLAGTVSTAVLSVPNGQPILMTQESSSLFGVTLVTNALTNITPSFPDGTYQFTISETPVSVSLPAGADLPNAPTLSDYAGAQSINAANDYTLAWEPFETGGELDFISLSVVSETNGETVFKSGDFGCPDALDGGSTSVLIPANTLASNSIYRVQITFVKAYTFDTNSIPDVALLAGTETTTSATISTGSPGAAGPAPVLSNAVALQGGGVSFDYSTTPGLGYVIQFSPNLPALTGWIGVATNLAVASTSSFTNSSASGSATGFYRILQQ